MEGAGQHVESKQSRWPRRLAKAAGICLLMLLTLLGLASASLAIASHWHTFDIEINGPLPLHRLSDPMGSSGLADGPVVDERISLWARDGQAAIYWSHWVRTSTRESMLSSFFRPPGYSTRATIREFTIKPHGPRPLPTVAWHGFVLERQHDLTTTGGRDSLFLRGRLWVIAALLLLPMFIVFGRWLRGLRHQIHRRTAGLCPACGYDLRESPGRCPECGYADAGLEDVPS